MSDAARGADYRKQLQHDVIRGSLWTVLSAAISLPVTFLVSLVVVHSLGAVEYGRLAIYTAAFAIGLTVVNAGTSEATVQWLAAARARGEVDDQIALVRRCSGYHMFVAVPLIACMTAALLRHAAPGFILLAVVANAAIQVLGTSTVVLTATAQNALAARLGLVTNLAVQAAVAATASTQHIAAATWSVQSAVLLLGPSLALAMLPAAMRKAVFRPILPRRWPAGFRNYALSACAGGLVATLVFGRSEIFVLRAHGDLVAVALFAIATTLAGQITVPIDSLMGPLMPASAGLVASAPELASRALDRAIRVSAILGALAAATALPVAVLLVGHLYGRKFDDARGALLVLGLVSCLQSVTHPISAFAFATRSAAAMLRINLVCLALDAGAALSLIPYLGLAGAVIANALAQILSLVLSARLVNRKLKRPPLAVALSARAFALGPLGAVVALIASGFTAQTYLAVIVAISCGAAIVGLGLAIMPFLRMTVEDADSITRSLPSFLLPIFELVSRLMFFVAKGNGSMR